MERTKRLESLLMNALAAGIVVLFLEAGRQDLAEAALLDFMVGTCLLATSIAARLAFGPDEDDG